MDIAGYSKTTPIGVATAPIKDQIADKVKEFLASRASVKAAWVMTEALDANKPEQLLGLRERISAARDLLDRGGQVVTQKVEVATESPIFILPPKNTEE